ncbi:hypothetical protein [Desulfosporosinus hippei]|uniref:Uncharacterized protein n=1 Tax=Desulfosporosinus hippei DSM 8344 TaxID=1121419 RepID=A0A1G8BCN9_9FIRM|nr:hypothetical protein [Desulfosporosinus hippei]SDH31012.1 hypothetical protein SAMN05443529_1125 [Desulfosporosinus hippei DSM 8344]
MRTSKILTYILYILVLLGALAVASWEMFMIKVWVGRNYTPIPGFIGSSVIYILLGLLLGLEHLVKEFRKDGNWSVNIIRLIIMGVPSGVFAFYLVLIYTLPIRLPSFLSYNNLFFQVSGIICGYTLITSFYKKEAILREEINEFYKC